ncbi:hypothetical protein ACO0LV_15250 [Pseudactinotalea sp. Z1739]|uniref:hypothetical protein n=1 Tax=Pseudactinotalea sp. Z1739 TaxID=3413028 RepID=UPI003C7CE2C4
MATAVPRLQDEQRRRVRAFTLSTIGVVILFVVAIITYALVVGFAVPGTGTIASVAPTQENGRDLMVRAEVTECDELTGIEVRESRNTVTLTARTTTPNATRWGGLNCPDVITAMFYTVRLDAPLGERVVADSSRPDAEVPVLADPADLLEPRHG